MVHYLLVFLFFGLSTSLFGQDERYYRQIISGNLKIPTEEQGIVEVPRINVEGKHYSFDLNGDGIEEVLIPQKRDGVDYLEVRDSSQRSLFSAKLYASGGNGWLYKMRLVAVDKETRALILFFDEGTTESKRFESMARIYLLTFKKSDLSTATLTEGPHFFHEKEAQRDQYWRRDYLVEVKDLDKDGINDIMIKYHHIQRVMKYEGNGVWKRF